TDAASRTVEFAHDPTSGVLSRMTLPDGRHVDYGYTSGLLTSVRDVAGHATTYSYDGGGRLSDEVDPNGHHVIRNSHDATSGRVSQQLDPLGNLTTFTWDPNTETSTMTDARGQTWTDVYRGNVLIRSVQPDGATTVDYDSNLNAVKSSDTAGHDWQATYD